MTRAVFAAALALLLSACGAADEQPDEWCALHRCEVSETTFDPVPELLAATECALVRLRAATGRDDLRIEAGGIPVYFSEDLMAPEEMPDGSVATVPVCGQTPESYRGDGPHWVQGIKIDPTPMANCPDMGTVVLHEAIHGLAPLAEHSRAGVFQARGGNLRLEETSLTALCGGFECLAFAPE